MEIFFFQSESKNGFIIDFTFNLLIPRRSFGFVEIVEWHSEKYKYFVIPLSSHCKKFSNLLLLMTSILFYPNYTFLTWHAPL